MMKDKFKEVRIKIILCINIMNMIKSKLVILQILKVWMTKMINL